MCVKCDIREAVNVSDWDEVVRLAQAEKDEPAAEPEPVAEPVKAEPEPVKADKS